MNKELNRVKNNIQKKINIISIDVYKSLSDTHEKELGQLKIKKQEIKNKLKIFSDKSKEKEFSKCR